MNLINPYRYYEGLNSAFEKVTKNIVYSATYFFPHSQKNFIRESLLTQSELVVYALAIAILLQATIGNPTLSSSAAYSICGTGIVLMSGGVLQTLKRHIQELGKLDQKKDRIVKIVLPLVLVVEFSCILYGIQSMFHLSHISFIALKIWSFCYWSFGTIGLHSFQIHSHRPQINDEISYEKIEELRNLKLKEECQYLSADIKSFKKDIRYLRGLLIKYPELREIYEVCLQRVPEQISYLKKTDLKDLDTKNLNALRCKLSIERNHLKHELNEMHLFIERNPEVKVCFEKCLQKEKQLKIKSN